MAIEDYWEWIALGIDLSFAALFYKLYQDRTKAAEEIRTVPVYPIDQQLVEHVKGQQCGVVPYVCVEGYVAPLRKSDTLRSRFVEDVGVIRDTLQTEHKSKRESGYWQDVKRVIKDYYDKVPFVLRGSLGSDGTEVEVEEPLKAYCLDDNLRITYDKFEKTEHGLLMRGIDRIFGDVSKGFQETERMLPVGTAILGIGRLSVKDGNLTLDPPLEGQRYILTTINRKELIKSVESGAKYLKVFWWIFRGIAVGLVSWWAYHHVKRLWVGRQERRVYEEIRAQTASLQENGDELEESSMCVVCLVNRRNVVILQCGHICVCVDCAQALPSPKKCPICRGGCPEDRTHIYSLIQIYQ